MKKFFERHFSFTPREKVVVIIFFSAVLAGVFLNLLSIFSSKQEIFDYTVLNEEFIDKSLTDPEAAPVDSAVIRFLENITAEDLQKLPTIGPVLAGRIIGFLEKNNHLAQLDDLLEIPGIGEKRLEIIKQHFEARSPK